MRKAVFVLSLAAVLGALSASTPGVAQAQSVVAVEPTAKGIVGCGLLGGEAVMLIEAAAGVRPGWAYILGGVLGAGAGAAGGYFLEQAAVGDNTLTGVAVGSLVLGLGLSIPTVVAVTSARRYDPERDQQNEDNTPSTGPLEEGQSAPASGGAAQPAPSSSPAPASGGASSGNTSRAPVVGGSGRRPTMVSLRPRGLFDLNPEGFAFSVPSITVGNAVSLHEMRQYGVSSVSELRVPLVSGTF
ncbi:MAG: hypothetical protein JNK72_10095 [Myxococcales bacterium]|nr:hypothetical protein [Myxococcales bacterium]